VCRNRFQSSSIYGIGNRPVFPAPDDVTMGDPAELKNCTGDVDRAC